MMTRSNKRQVMKTMVRARLRWRRSIIGKWCSMILRMAGNVPAYLVNMRKTKTALKTKNIVADVEIVDYDEDSDDDDAIMDLWSMAP